MKEWLTLMSFSPLSILAGMSVGGYVQQQTSFVTGTPVGLGAALIMWFAQVVALRAYVSSVQRRLHLPTEWYKDDRYLISRRPRYRAAVAASYPFMRQRPLPKVPSDLTWPLSRETDNGLTEMMELLYRNHRQSRGEIHAKVYAEVMAIDTACVKHGYRHADAATVVRKLGAERGLEAIRSRIPVELATALA